MGYFTDGSPVSEDPQCRADWHRSKYAYRMRGCRCPSAIEKARLHWRRCAQNRHTGSHTRTCGRPRPCRGVDLVAVDRACAGEPVGRPLTSDEFTLAVRRLTRRRMSASEIAELLGVHHRTVQRHRRREVAA